MDKSPEDDNVLADNHDATVKRIVDYYEKMGSIVKAKLDSFKHYYAWLNEMTAKNGDPVHDLNQPIQSALPEPEAALETILPRASQKSHLRVREPCLTLFTTWVIVSAARTPNTIATTFKITSTSRMYEKDQRPSIQHFVHMHIERLLHDAKQHANHSCKCRSTTNLRASLLMLDSDRVVNDIF